MIRASLVFLLAALLSLPALANRQSLPEQVEVQGTTLRLNGSATQKVLMIRLYDIGLYLEEPTADAQAAIASNQPKRIQLQVLRNLPRARVAKALRDGMARCASRQLPQLEKRIRQMEAGLRDVRKHDQVSFTYIPGLGTQIADGQAVRAVIAGKDFADALFGIWLDESTDAPKVRRALVQS